MKTYNYESTKAANGDTHHIFESLSEFVRIAEDAFAEKLHGDEKGSFTAYTSFKQAVDYMKTGWSDGYSEVVKGMSGMVEHSEYVDGEALVPSYSGAEVNVDAYVAGQPECYMDFDDVEENKPVLRVGVQFSAQAKYSTQCFTNRGSAMLSLVEVLERGGIPVELWGYAYTEYCGKTQRIDILLKASSEPIDTDKIAFVLAHAAFYRHIGFAVKCYLSKIGEHHGDPSNCRSTEMPADAFDVVTPYSSSFLRDKVEIKNWIETTCRNLGLELDF